MKVYSIGRDTACDICINDSTDVISRRHAILNVTPTGKMTIVDQSHNGTYVNGIRISPNVPVPVTRKDSISFAHVARLDWNRVPKSGMAIKYAVIGFGALVCVAVAGFGLKAAMGGGNSDAVATEKPAAADTTKAQKDETKTEETEKKDSKTKDTEKETDSNKEAKKEQSKKEASKKEKKNSSRKKTEASGKTGSGADANSKKTSNESDNNGKQQKKKAGFIL